MSPRKPEFGASPTSQPPLPQPDPHDAVTIAAAWFATGEDVMRLTHRWVELENAMMGDPVWAALSREERRFTPAQVRLTDIDDLKEGEQARQHAFLEQLVSAPTRDLSGALAKLLVVVDVMIPEDYPHCHQLISDTVETLTALDCPHCHKRQARSDASALLAAAAKIWASRNQV